MKRKLRCFKCRQHTNHDSMADYRRGSEPDDEYHWLQRFFIMRCAGCEEVTFLRISESEDDYDPETGPSQYVEQYPKGSAGRSPLDNIYMLPQKIRIAYDETVRAIDEGLPVLAGMGLRTLIEAICADQSANGRDLKGRIDDLAKKGVLAEKMADVLHAHRFLGNVAAHEVIAADEKELLVALDIAETVLKAIYLFKSMRESIRTGEKP